MTEPFFISLNQIQPSQLYINNDKLSSLIHRYNSIGNHLYHPVTLKKLDGRIIFTDGHTRAFALFISQEKQVKAIWDVDELDWDAYRRCVQWCRDEKIYSIFDLKDRTINSEEYEKLWINRCESCRS